MDLLFVVDDDRHAEMMSRFDSRGEAVGDLKRRAALAWDAPENRAPCTSWKTCGRVFQLVTYDASSEPWKELNREDIAEVASSGWTWKVDPDTFE